MDLGICIVNIVVSFACHWCRHDKGALICGVLALQLLQCCTSRSSASPISLIVCVIIHLCRYQLLALHQCDQFHHFEANVRACCSFQLKQIQMMGSATSSSGLCLPRVLLFTVAIAGRSLATNLDSLDFRALLTAAATRLAASSGTRIRRDKLDNGFCFSPGDGGPDSGCDRQPGGRDSLLYFTILYISYMSPC